MKFSEIPGNREIKRKLVQTVMDQRVSHAQLFFGPDDSSKLALAIAYAQFINCTGRTIPSRKIDEHGFPVEVDSCGECPSCAKFHKLAHPDLHFVYPVSTTRKVSKKPLSKYFIEDWRKFLFETGFGGGLLNWYEFIGIENKQGIINAEDCTDIITTLSYKSYESEYKVMIIWMVERLYYAAAPKILKILEEPPEKTLFILISEDPGQIIKTILSRTLMVKIPANEPNPAAQHEEDASLFPVFRAWMRDCYAAKVPELIRFSTETGKTGREKQKNFLNYALRVIEDIVSVNYRKQVPPGYAGEELEFIRRFSPQVSPGNLVEFEKLFNDAIFHIERNAHGPTLFLDLSLKIVRQFKPNFVPL
jgi:DNA polymerase-3 subunit delta'